VSTSVKRAARKVVTGDDPVDRERRLSIIVKVLRYSGVNVLAAAMSHGI
jgi:hypothetical protein